MQLLIHGADSPELPLRLFNLLAQQGAILTHAEIALENDRYRIFLDIRTERGDLIVEKARSMVLVSRVECQLPCGAHVETSPSTPMPCG